MAKKRRSVEEDDDELEVVEEDDDEEQTNKPPGRGPQPPRLSLTLPKGIRRKIRIAAAKADMEETDWCRTVLAKSASLTVEKLDI